MSVVIALAACGGSESSPETGTGPSVTTSGDAGPADAAPPEQGSRTPPASAPCGGDGGTLCLPGAPCASDDDCEAACVSGTCSAPTTTDGRRSASLGETDVDCGGALAAACAEGKACAGDADCASSICSVLTKTCTSAPSCRGASGAGGVETCGTGVAGTPEAIDSCCRSLPLPTDPTRRLDRYEITAGRVRAFVEALVAKGNGKADLRGFAKAYAAAHPTSQLADVEVGYPGVLDILPDAGDPNAPGDLAVHLGVFPLDPINTLDGCFVGDGGYGHPTYWQPPTVLGPYGIGAQTAPNVYDGKRVYSRDVLDQKPMNCAMPLVLATFCAWDGGELARTNDYRAVYGNHPYTVGTTSVWVPWASLLSVGEFNWRNGHGNESGLDAWPGFINPQPVFYAFPLPHDPANDDTPAIGAPGRFAKDVTAARSADGSGWYDVGGNLLEAAWLSGPLRSSTTLDICDVSVSPGPGETACARRGIPGTLRRAGTLPGMLLVGHSFEGHQQYGAKFLATGEDDDDAGASLRSITFQYGKVGGRCARTMP